MAITFRVIEDVSKVKNVLVKLLQLWFRLIEMAVKVKNVYVKVVAFEVDLLKKNYNHKCIGLMHQAFLSEAD